MCSKSFFHCFFFQPNIACKKNLVRFFPRKTTDHIILCIYLHFRYTYSRTRPLQGVLIFNDSIVTAYCFSKTKLLHLRTRTSDENSFCFRSVRSATVNRFRVYAPKWDTRYRSHVPGVHYFLRKTQIRRKTKPMSVVQSAEPDSDSRHGRRRQDDFAVERRCR